MLLTDWIEANNQAVAKSYPQFRTVEPPAGSGAILAWRGAIAPLRGSKELGLILDDLANSADVLMQEGKLIHDPSCRRIHSRLKFVDSIQSIDSSLRFQKAIIPFTLTCIWIVQFVRTSRATEFCPGTVTP
jgi:hypothetical protein